MSGPLHGVRVLEFAGIGPAPFCAMLLADLGADVVRIERAGDAAETDAVTSRGKTSLSLDLKSSGALALALAAIERADVLIEGFRPGVMERLGLGPDVALERNPRLVYGRMTGWGQTGPLAHSAGHDLTYIALTGALAAFGPAGAPPPPPLNLVGDFGGGALYLALGIAAALFERERSGRGQVVDAAVVDGTASLMALFSGMTANGRLSLDRAKSLLGGAAPNYRCYECADGKYVAVAPLEPKFFAALRERLGVDARADADWGAESATLAAIFKQKPRDEWAALLEGTDACVAPVLTLGEAPAHPHMRARGVYADVGGVVQPVPAPRFSRTACAMPPATAPNDGRTALARWGIEEPSYNASRVASTGSPGPLARASPTTSPSAARVVVVAGASGGIGAATVRAFVAAGFCVVLAAPPDALLDAAAREFASLGERALIVPTDITVRTDVDALVARALVAFGRIDVLANVAGIGSSPALCDCTDDELERVLAVNLLGAARLMHAVLPVMKAQRRGAIVNVGSVAGEAGVMGIYSASKFGLRGLSDSVRREVRSCGVHVTLVEPGFVRTPMNPSMRDLPGPEIVADAIVAAASRPRRVHVVPASYRVPVFLMNTFPALADLVFGSARIQHRLNRDARAERAARATVSS